MTTPAPSTLDLPVIGKPGWAPKLDAALLQLERMVVQLDVMYFGISAGEPYYDSAGAEPGEGGYVEIDSNGDVVLVVLPSIELEDGVPVLVTGA